MNIVYEINKSMLLLLSMLEGSMNVCSPYFVTSHIYKLFIVSVRIYQLKCSWSNCGLSPGHTIWHKCMHVVTNALAHTHTRRTHNHERTHARTGCTFFGFLLTMNFLRGQKIKIKKKIASLRKCGVRQTCVNLMNLMCGLAMVWFWISRTHAYKHTHTPQQICREI